MVPKNYKLANNIIANNIVVTKQNLAGPIPIASIKQLYQTYILLSKKPQFENKSQPELPIL